MTTFETKHDEYLNEFISSGISQGHNLSEWIYETLSVQLKEDEHKLLFKKVEQLTNVLMSARAAERELVERRIKLWDSKRNSGVATFTHDSLTDGM